MRNYDIKNFINDFELNSKYLNRKNAFKNYFLKGNFKKGFTLLFLSQNKNKEEYYFELDSQDVTYLVNKYKAVYDDILIQEKESEIIKTKKTISDLEEKLESLTMLRETGKL